MHKIFKSAHCAQVTNQLHDLQKFMFDSTRKDSKIQAGVLRVKKQNENKTISKQA